MCMLTLPFLRRAPVLCSLKWHGLAALHRIWLHRRWALPQRARVACADRAALPAGGYAFLYVTSAAVLAYFVLRNVAEPDGIESA